MKKNRFITLIAILAVVAVAIAALYFNERAAVADKTAQIEALTVEAADQAAQIEALTVEAADQAAQIESLSAEVNEQAAQIETLTADAAVAAAQIEEMNAEAINKLDQITALGAEVEAADAQIVEMTAEVENATAQIETLTAEAAAAASQIQALNEEVAGQEERIAELIAGSAEKDNQIADAMAQIEALNAEVTAADAQVASLNENAEELAGQILTLMQENDALRARVDYPAMDESALLAAADQLAEPLREYGYTVTVAKEKPAEEPVPAEEPEEVEAQTEEPEAVQAEGTTYTHPRGGYGFTYPSELVFLSRENVQDLVDMMLSGEMSLDGMDADALQQQAAVLEQQDMVMVMTTDGLMNVTFGYQDMGMSVTEEQFMTIYCPVLLQQYQAMYPNCEVLDAGSEYVAGENAFITQSLSLTADGIELTLVILYDLNGDYLYNAVFTVANEMLEKDLDYVNGVVESIAASYVYSEPAAE